MPSSSDAVTSRPYLLERVDDAAIVQLYADGFDALPLGDRRLIFHLVEAAIAGRDIYYDQRHRLNRAARALLEALVTSEAALAPDTAREVWRYTKLFWLNSGPYNAHTARKFVLGLTPEALREAVAAAASAGADLPLEPRETVGALVDRLAPFLLDPAVDPVVTNKNPEAGDDILASSASNLYEGVTLADLASFTERHPLNSRIVRRDGAIVEEVYRAGGRCGVAIEAVVAHLDAARADATPAMRRALDALVRFYRTGDEADRRAYDIAWVADDRSPVDTVNGFVEVYLDPRGRKGAWEALVSYVNEEKTRLVEALAADAAWFEQHLPCRPEFRREHVVGMAARAIDVVVETGEAGPLTAIGINLPNDEVIRERYGSKSVLLANVVEAYERSTPPEFRREFAWDDDEVARAEQYGALAQELATHLHEVLGHGSGRLASSLTASPQAYLKEHFSSLEETRADLVALYFIADHRLVELGIVADADHAALITTEYEAFVRNALVQLRRVRTGSQLEEDHMRNRQAITHWLMAHGAGVSRRVRDGRTYYVVVDAGHLRQGVAEMFAEVQRIKSEGDYDAARRLFETYGITFDSALRDEVVTRVERIGLASYTGFVMPTLEAVRDEAGGIVDVTISYSCDFAAQMLDYSRRSSLRGTGASSRTGAAELSVDPRPASIRT